MVATPLPLVEKSSGLSVEPLLPAAIVGKASAAQLVSLCRLLRRMAVANLLLTGLPDDFFAFLDMSAQAWLHHLRAAPAERRITGLAPGFFDALACGDLLAARAIADASPPACDPTQEHLDDFLFARTLMALLPPPGATPAPDLLARLEAAAEEDDPRVAVCRALVRRDATALATALDAWILERRLETEELAEEERLHPDDVPTTAKVWVELLAVLRLARIAGLATDEHVPLAPSVARRDPGPLPHPDTWKSLPSYREIG
jgi:hypothetical protein